MDLTKNFTTHWINNMLKLKAYQEVTVHIPEIKETIDGSISINKSEVITGKVWWYGKPLRDDYGYIISIPPCQKDEIKVFEPKAEILLDCIDETRSIKVCWIKGD